MLEEEFLWEHFLQLKKVASGFVPGDHGTTFGGGPLVCAAANSVLDTILDEGLLENSKKLELTLKIN